MENLYHQDHLQFLPSHLNTYRNYLSAILQLRHQDVPQEYVDLARDILVNGNKYLPDNVWEHDMIDDIYKISGGNKWDRENYIPGETIIYAKGDETGGSKYLFQGFAPDGGDPFGIKIGEWHY